MSMITVSGTGDFKKTYESLKKVSRFDIRRILEKYGEEGVRALSQATPVKSGLTARSWSYEIQGQHGSYSIFFKNSNINKNVNIAIIIEYGHGTRNGGYVHGRPYINQAITPVFDKIANDAWREVTSG